MEQLNRIAIYKNNRKITPNHPDWVGKINITETLQPGQYEVGLFIKTSKKDNKYLGGSIREAYKKPELKQETAKSFHEPEQEEDLNDDIPF